MPTAEKIGTVEELTETISGSNVIFLADFTGLDVASVTELRRELRQAEIKYQVVKNRLAIRAVEAAGISGLEEYLTGPTAMAFADEDPVEPAKILQKFIEDGGKLVIKSGVVDGQVVNAEEIERLASLPSREQLLASVVGGVQAPLSGLAGVLSGLMRNLVGLVAALEEKRREEGE